MSILTEMKADIRKKIIGAIPRLAKNDLQEAVCLLCDGLLMIGHTVKVPQLDEIAQRVTELRVKLGAQEGTGGSGFRRASINEKIGLAVDRLAVGEWAVAARAIEAALLDVAVLAASQNTSIIIQARPPGRAFLNKRNQRKPAAVVEPQNRRPRGF